MRSLKVMSVLSVLAALLLTVTGCGGDNDVMTETEKVTPATDDGPKTIHYVASVNKAGDNATRATLNGNKKYVFQSGDKLYITGTNISGVLDITDGPGTSNATFEGDLTYTGSRPGSGLELNATLVSKTDQVHTVDVGVVSTSYPTNAIATTLADAVEQYSDFTATSTFGSKAFTLNQHSTFLNFTVTFTDGTTAGTTLGITIKDGEQTLRTGSTRTADESGAVVAKFVAAFPENTTLDATTGTTLTFGDRAIIAIGQSSEKTLEADHIYNYNKTVAAYMTLSDLKTLVNNGSAYSNYLGYKVNSDGKIAETLVPGTLIGYVGYLSTTDVDTGVSGSRILVLASEDDARAVWGSEGTATGLTDQNAMTGYNNTYTLLAECPDPSDPSDPDEGHPAAYNAWNHSAAIPAGGSTPAHWFLPTMAQLGAIRDALGGYAAFKTKVNWSGWMYWVSTEFNADRAMGMTQNGGWGTGTVYHKQTTKDSNDHEASKLDVRACFAY